MKAADMIARAVAGAGPIDWCNNINLHQFRN